MSDSEIDLVNYFTGLNLPKTPFRLSASEIITDLPGYIANQIQHLQSGMSATTSRHKLIQLKQRLEEQENKSPLSTGGNSLTPSN